LYIDISAVLLFIISILVDVQLEKTSHLV